MEELFLSFVEVCRVKDVRKNEIHTAEPNSFEVDIIIEKLKTLIVRY